MRKKLFELLLQEMRANENINFITPDMGYGFIEKIEEECCNQFFNIGASEQLAMGMGVGFAIEGKIPIVYSITPFLLYRPFEWIRIYLNHEKWPVKLIGTGRDNEYLEDGFTHWAHDDFKIMECFPNIDKYWPENDTELEKIFIEFLYSKKPAYLNVRR